MAREQYGEKITVTGSKVIGPTLLLSIPFSSFAANGTYVGIINSVLNRGAKQRTFIINNKLNQPIATGSTGYLLDSVIQSDGGGIATASFTASAINNPGRQYFTSENATNLNAHVNSIMVFLNMGATAPTSGSVELWLVEVM